MKKPIFTLGMLVMAVSVNAQMMYKAENDTLRVQDIEGLTIYAVERIEEALQRVSGL